MYFQYEKNLNSNVKQVQRLNKLVVEDRSQFYQLLTFYNIKKM